MLPQHIWLSCSIVRRCVKPQLIPCFAFLRNTVSYAEHVLSYVRLALRIANCLLVTTGWRAVLRRVASAPSIVVE